MTPTKLNRPITAEIPAMIPAIMVEVLSRKKQAIPVRANAMTDIIKSRTSAPLTYPLLILEISSFLNSFAC